MNGNISSTAPFKSKLVQQIVEAKKGLTIIPAIESINENIKQVTRCANTKKEGDCTSCKMTMCPAFATANKIAAH
jgi:recombinational DNA repair protein RecR